MALQQLTLETLRQRAPSIFAEEAWGGVSSRYTFVPTSQIVERLMAESNLVPVGVRQSNVRDGSRKGFQRHEVRLMSRDALGQGLTPGMTLPTVSLTNSHDTAAALAIDAGLFRVVCSNGLMLPDQVAQSVRVRHTGNLGDVIEGVFEVVQDADEALALVDDYRQTPVSYDAQRAFATAALELRETALTIDPAELLTPRRREDREGLDWSKPKADLYTTLNVVQENLVKGGMRGVGSTGRRQRTRAIADIAADQKLNKALWTLAAELKKQL